MSKFKAGDRIRAIKKDIHFGWRVGDEFDVDREGYFNDRDGDWRFLKAYQNDFELVTPFGPSIPDPLLVQALEALRGMVSYEGHMVWCGHGSDMDKPCVCGLNSKHDAARAILTKAKERGL